MEGMQKVSTLLYLLNAREPHPSRIFAHVDAGSVHLGMYWGAIAIGNLDDVSSYEMDVEIRLRPMVVFSNTITRRPITRRPMTI